MAYIVTGKQIRAARALLGWSQYKLAEKAGISVTPIARFEREEVDTKTGTLMILVNTLENAGIEFRNEKDGTYGVMFKAGKEQ